MMKLKTSISLEPSVLRRLRGEGKRRDRSVSFIIEEWLREKYFHQPSSAISQLVNTIGITPGAKIEHVERASDGTTILQVKAS